MTEFIVVLGFVLAAILVVIVLSISAKKSIENRRRRENQKAEFELREAQRLHRKQEEVEARNKKRSAQKLRRAEKLVEEKDRFAHKKAEQKAKSKSLASALRKSPDFGLVQMFARKFANDLDDEGLNQLKQTLGSKKWNIELSDLRRLVRSEQAKQRDESTSYLLSENDPKTLREFVENFVLHCNSSDFNQIRVLERLLKKRDLLGSYNLKSLQKTIKEREHQLEIALFKSRLDRGEKQVLVDEIDVLSGFEFEQFLKDLFQRMGYEVIQTKLSGDQGADIVATKLKEKTVIQAKRFSGKVGNSAVQEIVAAISFYEAHKGMVVTSSYFTPSAVSLAAANNIELVDRRGLENFIKKYW